MQSRVSHPGPGLCCEAFAGLLVIPLMRHAARRSAHSVRQYSSRRRSLLGDGDARVETPEIPLYEPLPNGRPELMEQFFHLFHSPNRFGLKAFYALQV